jgi:hypothetical protein
MPRQESHERYAIQTWYICKKGGGAFAAIVLGDDDVINFKAAPNAATLSSTDSIDGLLEDWDANFTVLQSAMYPDAIFMRGSGVTGIAHPSAEDWQKL